MSRLLSLPAELRLRIYEYALTALDNAIVPRYPHQPNKVNPNIGTSLLRICKQIYHEAHDMLYTKNRIFILGGGGGDTRLPPHALKNLRHVFLLLKSSVHLRDERLVDYIDFPKFQAMTKLQSLRICVIDTALAKRPIECWTPVLSAFIESVPPGCGICFGTESVAEKTFAYSTMRTRLRKCYELCETEPLPWEFERREYEEAMKG